MDKEPRPAAVLTGMNTIRKRGTAKMRRQAWVGIFLLCLLYPQNAEATFVEALGLGARAMAMGSAYTAVADDLSAVYYNPAGLSQLNKHEIMFGYILSWPDLREGAPSDPSFSARQVVPYHLKCPVIGVGINLDRAFNRKMPVHARLAVLNMIPDNFKSIYRLWDPEVSVPRWIRYGDYWDRVHLMGALSLQADKFPWIRVGAGFRFIISGTEYLMERHGIPGLDVAITDLEFNTKVGANLDYDVDNEATPTAGVLITPTDNLRLGYSFQNSLSLVVDPLAAQALARLVLAGTELLALPMNISLIFEGYYWPQQHTWGISYLFQDKLLVALDVCWFQWSKFTSISRGSPDPKWEDSLVPRIGLEYSLSEKISVRCGYYFEPSPIPDQTRASNYLDNDRHVFSVGAGFRVWAPFKLVREPMNIDLAFQYMALPRRVTKKEPGFFPDTTYETSGDIYTLATNVTFQF